MKASFRLDISTIGWAFILQYTCLADKVKWNRIKKWHCISQPFTVLYRMWARDLGRWKKEGGKSVSAKESESEFGCSLRPEKMKGRRGHVSDTLLWQMCSELSERSICKALHYWAMLPSPHCLLSRQRERYNLWSKVCVCVCGGSVFSAGHSDP